MRIGFTGTQVGMTDEQKKVVDGCLFVWNGVKAVAITEAHHGDCIGADAEFHQIAHLHGIPIIIHPPSDESRRAFMPVADVSHIHSPKPYLERNKDIVRESDMIIATPKGNSEELRSGTWATIRCAIKSGKTVVIVYPDGSVERRNG